MSWLCPCNGNEELKIIGEIEAENITRREIENEISGMLDKIFAGIEKHRNRVPVEVLCRGAAQWLPAYKEGDGFVDPLGIKIATPAEWREVTV